MRIYQPIFTDDLGIEVEHSNFYYHLDNAKADYPGAKVAVFESDEVKDPTFVDRRRIKISIIHDDSPLNPFEDWDCNYPLNSNDGHNYGKDYSNGDIDNYLLGKLSYEFVQENFDTLLDLVETSREEFDEDYPIGDFTEDERVDYLYDMLRDYITEENQHRANFCELFDIKHYFGTSKGYSQGDCVDVFICWTPEFGKLCGVPYESATVKAMESTFELYGQWAWGDVYGFNIEDEEDEDSIGSCFGFYGTNWEENGMLEAIMEDVPEGYTEEEIRDIIEDLEVKYRY